MRRKFEASPEQGALRLSLLAKLFQTKRHGWPGAVAACCGFGIAILRDGHCSTGACHRSELFTRAAFEVAIVVGVTRILPEHMKTC